MNIKKSIKDKSLQHISCSIKPWATLFVIEHFSETITAVHHRGLHTCSLHVIPLQILFISNPSTCVFFINCPLFICRQHKSTYTPSFRVWTPVCCTKRVARQRLQYYLFYFHNELHFSSRKVFAGRFKWKTTLNQWIWYRKFRICLLFRSSGSMVSWKLQKL